MPKSDGIWPWLDKFSIRWLVEVFVNVRMTGLMQIYVQKCAYIARVIVLRSPLRYGRAVLVMLTRRFVQESFLKELLINYHW